MATEKKKIGISRHDKSFRRDVSKAKMLYRKKRMSIIMSICLFLLVATLIRTYFYSKEKENLEKNIQDQQTTIAKLKTDNKVNDVIINKLKDPSFIIDLVRQEYGMSYNGEVVFNIPLKENYMQNAINSIMTQNIEEELANTDKSKLIEDANLESIIKLRQQKEKEAEAKKKKEAESLEKQNTVTNTNTHNNQNKAISNAVTDSDNSSRNG